MHFRKQKFMFHLVFVLSLMQTNSSFSQNLFINEIMSQNSFTIADEDNDYSDWIEIYNSGQSSINIEGYFLSDDPDFPEKWCFSSTIIEPDSFLLIFASDKNRNSWPQELHTNFRLSINGESLIFSNPDTIVIDQTDFSLLDRDISYGRIGNGNPEWGFFDIPTPLSDNNSSPVPLEKASPPQLSIQSGSYPNGTTLELSSLEGDIFYTTDGSIPDENSTEYITEIILESVTVIRATCYVPNKRPSEIVHATYIVDFESELDIISIITDPFNFWDPDSGIYVLGNNAAPEFPYAGANFWKDWERPIYLELFDEEDRTVISDNFGVRIHGGYSRLYSQKSLRVYARNRYENPIIENQIFPTKPIFSFKRLILRNSGTDWHETLFRDALIIDLLRKCNFAYQAYRPSILFLNGDYWGIHNIRERVDKYFLESNCGADPESIDLILAGVIADEGSSVFYRSMAIYARDNDINEEAVYDSLSSMMNIDNYLDYFAIQIFIGNTDWPSNNNRCWRTINPDSRFEWILYDTDMGFGRIYSYDFDFLSEITSGSPDGLIPPSYTELFRELLENDTFRENFIIRSCDLSNIIFEEDRVLASIEKFKSGIEPEIDRHFERWYPEGDWEASVEVIRNYIHHRKPHLIEHLRDNFELGDDFELIINNIDHTQGRVLVNSYWLETDNFSGTYFEGSNIQLIAEPSTGYQFVGWSGDIESASDTLNFLFDGETTLQPNFEPVSNNLPIVIINEINYNSCESFDPGDWIELYAYNQNVDLSGWTLSDGNDTTAFIFPNGFNLTEGSFLVIARDPAQFSEAFISLPTPIGGLNFGLSSNGDQIILKNQDAEIVDFVEYESSQPWPTQPNGNGPTLELNDISLPNQHSHNWSASFINYGTPNMSTSDLPDPEKDHLPAEFKIDKVFPNPFNSSIQILVSLPEKSDISLSVFNVLGQHVKDIHKGQLNAGIFSFHFNAGELTSGIYFIQAIVPGKLNHTEKIILLK